jgi:hypothetical protein
VEERDYWTCSDDQLEEELRIRATKYDGWEFSIEERDDATWVAGFQEDFSPDGDSELKAYFMAALKQTSAQHSWTCFVGTTTKSDSSGAARSSRSGKPPRPIAIRMSCRRSERVEA